MTDSTQPITLADIFSANFNPMSENDYDAFQGIEGVGSIAEFTKDNIAYLFVMDAVAGDSSRAIHPITEIKVEVFPAGHADNNGISQVFRIAARAGSL